MTQTLENRLAGRGRRFIATLVDALLVPALTILLVMVTGVMEHAQDYQNSKWIAPVLLLAVLSYLILNGYWLLKHGQTVGKRLMKIAIVSTATGERAPFWRLVAVRAPFFPLLFLIVAPALAWLPIVDLLLVFTKHRRCVHDYVAGTAVVTGNA